MAYELCYFGNPVLRQKASEVAEVNDEIKELIGEMIRLMKKYNGMGIAAPQIGVSKRVFIHTVRGIGEDGYPVYGSPKVYINPKITVVGDEEWTEGEGCLSLPKIYEDVTRPYKIKVEALDEDGKAFEEEVDGWLARPVLHENDHLNGVLFIDRILPHRKKLLAPQLKKIKKKFSK